MKHLVLIILGLVFFINTTTAQQKSDTTMIWKSFEINDLKQQLAQSKSPWLPFLKVESLNCGVYALPKGGEDKQSPHSLDEVYYVLEGKASIEIGDEKSKAQQGSIIYVKAGIPHRFFDITEDLKVLVFFAAATSK